MASISISRIFEWNVLSYTQVSKTFEWNVGDGPLFWYRIEWKDPILPPNSCISSIDVCSITPISCTAPSCTLTLEPCPSGQECITDYTEIWHMMATSVEHLCSRLNKEICQRKPAGKVFKKVEKYDIPALCCDVDRYISAEIPMLGVWDTVNFCKCECVSYVDPVDCGNIRTPCDSDTNMTTQLFGMLPQHPTLAMSGFAEEPLAIFQPKSQNISTKCNCQLPATLSVKHNIGNANVLSDFLARHSLKMPETLELSYDNNSWRKNLHYNGNDEEWNLLMEWSCGDEAAPGDYGWKFHIHVQQLKQNLKKNTRIVINFATYGTLNEEGIFGINFNINTESKSIASTQAITALSKTLHDEIGLFCGNWKKDPFLSVQLNTR